MAKGSAIVITAVAPECMSIKDIDASRARWEMLCRRPAEPVDNGKALCAYAASFDGSETPRQAVAKASADRGLCPYLIPR
jgi:hypothetical protein